MKEFFEAFNIPKERRLCTRGYCNICQRYIKNNNCDGCNDLILEYPPITSDIVLNLATILNKEVLSKIECCCLFCGQSVDEITKNILDDCIDHQKDIYTQVRALFNAE